MSGSSTRGWDPTYIQEQIEAKPEWHIAWLLSEMQNDEAPIGWSRYIPYAQTILRHYDVTPVDPESS